ncbi:class I SAM-dependent methyltransferase [Streptomyces sp. MBT56]|uniref:class I SAM-dependent methyltransferase n=1 Tax=unclassified Streptomyces TaxID=2593676 RepID=UPI00190B3F96|nr:MULTISPECIES: methyltransferase domain-containing protein [unclassified Streptomyces]MBK3558895.1 class I SAM-dependent methyltransferase [Streptomyces sp. MBT56]MBK3602886.1 class I SAM-dependent methyltransferase [Streptomyces sp. MBT54]MBK3614879.1 class I SAM-dependent methyltransferase [Streptomyces sp. MBT98]MBK6044634.1 class I SAM-dependent methyltransferase [Streptomyces sp. MBT55]
MNPPEPPATGVRPEQEALFSTTAEYYARFRPGLPGPAVHLLAGTLAGRTAPVLLDLGTGTGQVPQALLIAVRHLAHVEAVDVNRAMLVQTRSVLDPLLGDRTLRLVHGPAHGYTSAPGTGSPAPDLVTCCRSFHWMDRPGVLAMADRVAAPDATVAIMGDGSLWTYPAPWTRQLRELIRSRLGTARRTGPADAYTAPVRTYEEDLAASPWSDVAEHRFPVTRTWTPPGILGYLRTTSFANAGLFPDTARHDVFERDALTLLTARAEEDGPLVEQAEFRVLLARRPGA